MAAVLSVDPSSTTMISVRGQACAKADSIVCPIQDWALKAGIRIDTSGFIR
jgi:hypothetical protein